MANANSVWMANRIVNDMAGMSGLTLKLYTNSVNKSGVGTEVSGGTYAAQTISFEKVPAVNGIARNDAMITFTNMPAVVVKSLGVWSGSNLVVFGDLTVDRRALSGEDLAFLTGDILASWLP